MEVIKTVEQMAALRDKWRTAGYSLGVVPTMGYLHTGHLALAERARAENDKVIATIFVNPLQFGPKEDFGRYPRNLEGDLAMLEKAGVDAVFNPEPAEMYPPGFEVAVEVGGITDLLEGAHRPGHFRGVTTVVSKLFHITGAQRAYFGQKDAQQVAVIKKMVRDLNFPLQIVVCPTVREADGLAMSSRNAYLTSQERQAAIVLYRALSAAKNLWESSKLDGRNGATLRQVMQIILDSEPLARPDYVSAANPLTLSEYEGAIEPGAGVLLSMAMRLGQTRLIDNFLLD